MDEQGFRDFYARTARPLRAYLRRSSGNPTLADDLMQEAYLRYLRSGFSSDEPGHCKSYLYRIATNLLRDHYRRSGRETDDVPEVASGGGEGERFQLRTDVGRLMALLRPRDRQMLWLAYAEGASHEEIAAVLGTKPASIKSMLFRARERMAGLLRNAGLAPDREEPR